jgi:hypothetical protein
MNWPSARWSRAAGPRTSVNRAPDIATPVSKSRPIAGPIRSCSRGGKANSVLVPRAWIRTLPVSSVPSGTSGAGRLGIAASALSSSAVSAASSASSVGNAALSAATSAISDCARGSSFCALAWPIALDSSLRRVCAVCASAIVARRRSSIATSAADTGAPPRRASAASKAAGFSRMRRISCMARAMPRRVCRRKSPP